MRRFVLFSACVFGIAACPPPGEPPPPETGVQAKSVMAFAQSVTVGGHLETVPASKYVPLIQYLGLKTFIVVIGEAGSTGSQAKILDLINQTGVDAFVRWGSHGSTATVDAWAAAINSIQAATGKIIGVDGPNEPNNFTANGGGGAGDWAPIAALQRAIYVAIKAQPSLGNIMIGTPSEVGAMTTDSCVRYLTVPAGTTCNDQPIGTQLATHFNPHPYADRTGGVVINNIGWDNAKPDCPSPSPVYDSICANYGLTWLAQYVGYSNAQLQDVEALPRFATEWHWSQINTAQAAQIELASWFSFFKRGYTFASRYQLVDGEGGTPNSGMFGTAATVASAHPIATYVHNLMAILAETSAHPAPGMLNYVIAAPPSTVHDMLLQHSNGKFWLAVWNEQASGSSTVTVDLTTPRAQVRVFDPVVGTTAQQTLSAVTSVPLTITGYGVRLLEITL